MTTTMTTRSAIGLAASLLAAALTIAPAANAQAAVDARWQGLLGCWQPVTSTSADSYTAWMEQRARDAQSPKLCILPTANAKAVEFLTVAGGQVTARDTVDAGNGHVARKRDDCDGWEGASWSADGHRVYLRSEYSCGSNVARTTSGMLALSSSGELMRIDEMASGGSKSVHIARYQSVAAPDGVRLDSSRILRADAVPVTAARAAMSGALTGADIVDAVNSVDELVVEAWLVERGDRFVVDAKRLAALADEGVPGRITDLMVALAYPKVFALDRSARVASAGALQGSGRTVYVTLPPSDPFGYQNGFGYRPYGYSPYGYSPYGYSPYSYLGYGNGYNPYGYGYVYQPPIVIVRGSGGTPAHPHGRVVNGRGYTRDPAGTSSSGSTSARSGAGSGSSSGNSGASNGSSSTSSSGSSPSSGETRHAKPRP